MFNANVVRVLVASPSDVNQERQAVVRSIVDWNARRAEAEGIVFLPLLWEISSIPNLDPFGGQGALNKQLVDKCSAVIGLFWTTLGTPTMNGRSGTIEEIERAESRGLPVHTFFKQDNIPIDVDADNLSDLRAYRKVLAQKALYGTFVNLDDLGHQVTKVLEADAALLRINKDRIESEGNAVSMPNAGNPTTISSGAGGTFLAIFRRTGSIAVLQIKNNSQHTVKDLKISATSLGDGPAPNFIDDGHHGALDPLETWTTRVFVDESTSDEIRLRITGYILQGEVTESIDVRQESS